MKVSLELRADDLNCLNSIEQLIEFVIELEKEIASMDFTEPLYQYFKSIMEKEMPENL